MDVCAVSIVSSFFLPEVTHWCFSPTNVLSSNLTLDSWKALALPNNDSLLKREDPELSACSMHPTKVIDGRVAVTEGALHSCLEWEYGSSFSRHFVIQEGNKGRLCNDADSYREVDGVWLHNMFNEEKIRSAINYQSQDRDLFLITYPKCGSMWVQHIMNCILCRGKPAPDGSDAQGTTRFIDIEGVVAADKPSLKCSLMMTHLPPCVFKPSEKAKYIYLTRNPYDCAVSHYHFLKGFTPKTITDVSFGRFLHVSEDSMFLAGKVSYGDYFDHLIPWYEHRGDDNVLFITYEQQKADTKGVVLKIADFIGEAHGRALRKDDQLIERILDACSVQSMREFYQEKPADEVKMLTQGTSEASSEITKQSVVGENEEKHEGSGFVRKAVVGDWRSHFTPEQVQKTKAWIAEKTKKSDVMDLWVGLDLP